MNDKTALIPLVRTLLEQSIQQGKFDENEKQTILKLKSDLDELLLQENASINHEVASFVKDVQHESPSVKLLRGILRPSITSILTLTFVFLIVLQTGFFDFAGFVDQKVFDQIFTVFLAIYGPIIGFWFGERTVEKNKEQ
ncbi:MAG: hypothetical protein U9R28_11865 [Pseudomonadota bacterium]|nr:hypothetical protein [Pseudomonadota bacterium]